MAKTGNEKIAAVLKGLSKPVRKDYYPSSGSSANDTAGSPAEQLVSQALDRMGCLQDRLWAVKNKLRSDTPLEAVASEMSSLAQLLASGGAPSAADAVSSDATLAMSKRALSLPALVDYTIGQVYHIAKTRDARRLRALKRTIRVAKEIMTDTMAPVAGIPVIDVDSSSDYTASADFLAPELIDPPWKGERNPGETQYDGSSQFDQNPAAVSTPRTPSPNPVADPNAGGQAPGEQTFNGEGMFNPGNVEGGALSSRTPEPNPISDPNAAGTSPGEQQFNGPNMFDANSAAMVAKRLDEMLGKVRGPVTKATGVRSVPAPTGAIKNEMGSPWPHDLATEEFLSGKDEKALEWGKDSDTWP